MPMMTSQTLKSVNFRLAQKSLHLENKTFFLQIKRKSLHTHQRLTYGRKCFVALVTSNTRPLNHKNKNFEENLLVSFRQMLPLKWSFPCYERTIISPPPKAAIFDKSASVADRKGDME